MKQITIFEKGEMVGIKMQIEVAALENGEMKYKLKDPRSQKEYPYIFSENDLFVLTDEQGGQEKKDD